MSFTQLKSMIPPTKRLHYVLINLLCVGVILLMLGMPQTFWDLGASDLVQSSMLEGFAIPSIAWA
ncbi:MAG TPA: hypothetical protein VKE92_00765, partial [Anaerolineales bacterium]|nr:hypothetical protein [Anaerolineales bacterium]